ncbi:MAG TPA: hypothetical protein EYH40_05215 [Desulfurococcales archaeon]|nr:hypothetical protein [Desulfurococcales archaeon]
MNTISPYDVFEVTIRLTNPLLMCRGEYSYLRVIVDEVYDYVSEVELYSEGLLALHLNRLVESRKGTSGITLVTNIDIPQFTLVEVLDNGYLKVKTPKEMRNASITGRMFLIPFRNSVVKGLACKCNEDFIYIDVGSSNLRVVLGGGIEVNSPVIPDIRLERLGSSEIVGWPLSRIVGLITLILSLKMLSIESTKRIQGYIVQGRYNSNITWLKSILEFNLNRGVVAILSYIDAALSGMNLKCETPIVFFPGKPLNEISNVTYREVEYLVTLLNIPFFKHVGYILIPVKYTNTLHEIVNINSVISACRTIASLVKKIS